MNADVEKAVALLTQFAKHERNCIGDYWGKDFALLSLAVMAQALRDQEAEIAALRSCAVKYLRWLEVKDPEAGLERDIRDPAMTAITTHLGATHD